MTQKIICLLLATILSIPTFPQALFSHPWKGRKVAFLGDSITDPRNNGSKKKYWNYLQEWLNITPLVYGRSGWQWNGMTTQADSLFSQHGNDFDAIIIFCGTNDFNDAVFHTFWPHNLPCSPLHVNHHGLQQLVSHIDQGYLFVLQKQRKHPYRYVLFFSSNFSYKTKIC